jgi:hypothetical protein
MRHDGQYPPESQGGTLTGPVSLTGPNRIGAELDRPKANRAKANRAKANRPKANRAMMNWPITNWHSEVR